MNIPRLLLQMAACLCVTIEEEGLPKPCWCGVVPGATVVADFMPDCFGGDGPDGMAWVRLASTYPAFQPGITVENPAESHVAGLGVDIEVGILRSIPLSEEGISTSDAEQSFALQMQDMLAARKAIVCCPEFERGDFILGQYTPVGPMGGVVGGAWNVMVQQQ